MADSASSSDRQKESYASARFYVDLGEDVRGVFTEVGGLQMECEVTELAEGGRNDFVHKLPGRVRVGNVTLTRGLIRSDGLWKWVSQMLVGAVVPRTMTIALIDQTGSVVVRWSLRNAFPVKWTGPQLGATKAEVAVETIELAHEGLQE